MPHAGGDSPKRQLWQRHPHPRQAHGLTIAMFKMPARRAWSIPQMSGRDCAGSLLRKGLSMQMRRAKRLKTRKRWGASAAWSSRRHGPKCGFAQGPTATSRQAEGMHAGASSTAIIPAGVNIGTRTNLSTWSLSPEPCPESGGECKGILAGRACRVKRCSPQC